MTTHPDGPAGYRILQSIGHGASSTVYEAEQSSTGRRVALKVVAASTPGGDAERLFTRERSVLAELGQHPHIVSIIDAGEWDGRFWLATEYCPYGSVAATGEQLHVADAVAVLAGIGTALSVAHGAGLVHCDVKPANILRNHYGSPALGDFGIAKFVLATGQGSTATGYTLDHASPEVLDGERPTGASDVWSLGTSVWELLEGRSPFRQAGEVSQSAVIRRICLDPTPPPTRDDLPEDLVDLLAEMTQKAPADRPSIDDVVARAHALENVVGAPDPARWSQTIAPATEDRPAENLPWDTDLGPSPDQDTHVSAHPRVAPSPPQLERREPAPRRRGWTVVAAAVLALALLGGGGAVTWRLANAESAPVALPPPPASTTTAPAPSAPVPPSVTTPEPVDDPAPTADRTVTEKADPTTTADSPPPTSEKKAGIGSINLTNSSCSFHGGNSCGSTSNHVSFSTLVKDTDGNELSDGCTASVVLTKTDKNSSNVGSGTCGSGVSFNANGSGDYIIQVNVSYQGSSQARSFRMTVE